MARIRADDTESLRVPSAKSVNPRNPWSAVLLFWAKAGGRTLGGRCLSAPGRGVRARRDRAYPLTGRAPATAIRIRCSISMVTGPSAPADGFFASMRSAPPASAADASSGLATLTSRRTSLPHADQVSARISFRACANFNDAGVARIAELRSHAATGFRHWAISPNRHDAWTMELAHVTRRSSKGRRAASRSSVPEKH